MTAKLLWILFYLICSVLFTISSFAQTELNGVLSNTLELNSSDNPVLIKENFRIAENGHLIINAGVIIEISDGIIITVDGRISCDGEVNNYIQFVPSETNWGGIIFKNKEIKSTFRFVEFRDGFSPKTQNSLIYLYGSSPSFEFCKFISDSDLCNATRSSQPDFGGSTSRGYNSFIPGNNYYAIINNGTLNINAKNNCWSGNVEDLIIDKSDNSFLGVIDFEGVRANCDIAVLSPPELFNPLNNSTIFSNELNFIWNGNSSSINYHFQLSGDSLFNYILSDNNTINNSFLIENELKLNKKYYWRVRADNEFTSGEYSEFNSFYLQEEFDILIPVLIAKDTVFSCNTLLEWSIGGEYDYFQLQYWNLITGVIGGNDSIIDTYYGIILDGDAEYAWRVRTVLQNKFGEWSDLNKFIYVNKYLVSDSLSVSSDFIYLDYIDGYFLTYSESEEYTTIYLQDNEGIYLDTLALDLINIKIYKSDHTFIGEAATENILFKLNIQSNNLVFEEINTQSKNILFNAEINLNNNLIKDSIIIYDNKIEIYTENTLLQNIDIHLNKPYTLNIDVNNDAWEDVLVFDDTGNKIKLLLLKNNKINYTFEFIDEFNAQLNDILILDFNTDGYEDIIISAGDSIYYLKNLNGVFFTDTISQYSARHLSIFDQNNNGIPEVILSKNDSIFAVENVSNIFVFNSIFKSGYNTLLSSINEDKNELILQNKNNNIIKIFKEKCSVNQPLNSNMRHYFNEDLFYLEWINNDYNIRHEIKLINKNTGQENIVLACLNKLIIRDLASGNYELRLKSKNINNQNSNDYIYSFKTPDLYGKVPASWNYSSMTGSNSIIKIDNSYFDNKSDLMLDNYDAIGVFYYENNKLKCGGYSIINSTQTNVITAWKNNSISSEKDGFNTLEKYVFKKWNAKDEIEEFILPTFISGPDYFTSDTLSIIGDFNIAQSPIIALEKGWNYLTLNLIPTHNSLSELFDNEPITLDADYLSVSNIQTRNSVQVFSNKAVTTIVTGDQLGNSTVNTKKLTWQMLPYLSNKYSLPKDYLNNYLNDILLIKDEKGNLFSNNSQLDNIIFEPNKSYKIIYKNDVEINYLLLSQNYLEDEINSPGIKTSCGYNNSGVNMNLIVELNDASDYQEIKTYYLNQVAACNDVISQKSQLTVWGNDYFEAGLNQSFPLEIVYTDNTGLEKLLDYTATNLLTGEEISSLRFAADAIILIKEKLAPNSVRNHNIRSNARFSGDEIIVESQKTYSEIRLYNSFGKEIALSVSKQQNTLVLSIYDQNISSGVYFLQLTNNESQEIMPILKLK